MGACCGTPTRLPRSQGSSLKDVSTSRRPSARYGSCTVSGRPAELMVVDDVGHDPRRRDCLSPFPFQVYIRSGSAVCHRSVETRIEQRRCPNTRRSLCVPDVNHANRSGIMKDRSFGSMSSRGSHAYSDRTPRLNRSLSVRLARSASKTSGAGSGTRYVSDGGSPIRAPSKRHRRSGVAVAALDLSRPHDVALARKRHSPSPWWATKAWLIFRANGWLNGAEALSRGRARMSRM
jgi:hypothetical protein